MSLVAEASLDLADDAELMGLMIEANFVAVFVGIETPNEAALRETKKLQNLWKGGTMLDRREEKQLSERGVAHAAR